MHNFDSLSANLKNSFAKNNPQLLQNFFKTSDVTSLWIADMDFEIAKPVSDEIKRIANRGVYAYEFSTSELNKAITGWFKKRHHLKLNPNHLLQVPCVLTGISVLIHQFTKENDGVLIQTPVYHMFSTLINNLNRKVVENPLVNNNGNYTMDFLDLEQKFKSGNVKIMVLCNPHNPVGRVWKKEELQRVLELANTYGIKIISDEIHADIIFSGNTFCSLLSLGAEDHFAMLGSTAKTFGMQSISNGFIYVPNKENHELANKLVAGLFLSHGNTFTTFATITAYTHGEDWLSEMMTYLSKTKDWIELFVKTELPGVSIIPVEGTYQMWIDFSGLGYSTSDLNHKIIHSAKLGLAQGDWFDKSGKHDQFMRLNFASPLAKIQNAFKNLKTALI